MKRATKGLVDALLDNAISIHALVKRATTAILALGLKVQISIHALVKRATVISKVISMRG